MKKTPGDDSRDLIDVDLPPDHPVTEQTIAACIWSGMMVGKQRPIPEEVRKKIKPGMSRERITEIIKKHFNK